ncbi:MAG: CRTAC1 family protein [Planctomycetes bacterium]|nr:CRTAC1 family protein [Planctomycetota bacterium]
MKRTLLLLCLVLYAAAMALMVRGRVGSDSPPPRAATVPLPDPDVSTRPPRLRFRDCTGEAGIHFQHESGQYGALLFPEINGAGCGFFDFDNDGDLDLLLVNSGTWPHRATDPAQPTAVHALYRNDGNGRFTDVGTEMGLATRVYGQGVCFGDIDNDGYEDVLITGVGRNLLFRNDQGRRFVEISAEAGVGSTEWSVSAAFLDYDRDGRLDLFVSNYVKWSLEEERRINDLRESNIAHGEERRRSGGPMLLPQRVRNENASFRDMFAYGNPALYGGTFCALYRNVDGLHFQDVSEESGIRRTERGGKPVAKALGVAVCDYNDDGWPDIAVANDGVPNLLFKNLGHGRFLDVAPEVGLSTSTSGQARAGMGIQWADFRNNQSIAMAVGNFATEVLGLYMAQDPERSIFVDVALAEGVGAASRPGVTWGLFFFDYDLDGWLDLFTVNGHTHLTEARVQSLPYEQKPVLYWNRGPRRGPAFITVGPEESGPDLFTPVVGRGTAFGDIDSDGDLDILVSANMGPARLYRNEAGPDKNFIRLRLAGVRSNRSAIGARVRVRTGRMWQRREVTSGSSYASQSELTLTFGLGDHPRADEVEITWPSGRQQVFRDVPGRRTIVVTEGQSLP